MTLVHSVASHPRLTARQLHPVEALLPGQDQARPPNPGLAPIHVQLSPHQLCCLEVMSTTHINHRKDLFSSMPKPLGPKLLIEKKYLLDLQAHNV